MTSSNPSSFLLSAFSDRIISHRSVEINISEEFLTFDNMLKIKGLIFHMFLILSILLSLPIISVASQEYKVGCKVGDWATYEYKIIGARETDNFKVTITAINGTNI